MQDERTLTTLLAGLFNNNRPVFLFGGDGEEDETDSSDTEETAPDPQDADGSDDAADDKDDDTTPITKAEARKLAREAQSLRKRLREAEAKAEEYENAQKSDLEKAKDAERAALERAAALEANLKRMAVERAIEAEAAKLKFHDPADALAAFGSYDDLLDEDGNVDASMIADELGELAKTKSYLISSGTRNVGKGDGGARGTKKAEAPDITTPEGYAARVKELHEQNVKAGRIPLPSR